MSLPRPDLPRNTIYELTWICSTPFEVTFIANDEQADIWCETMENIFDVHTEIPDTRDLGTTDRSDRFCYLDLSKFLFNKCSSIQVEYIWLNPD